MSTFEVTETFIIYWQKILKEQIFKLLCFIYSIKCREKLHFDTQKYEISINIFVCEKWIMPFIRDFKNCKKWRLIPRMENGNNLEMM